MAFNHQDSLKNFDHISKKLIATSLLVFSNLKEIKPLCSSLLYKKKIKLPTKIKIPFYIYKNLIIFLFQSQSVNVDKIIHCTRPKLTVTFLQSLTMYKFLLSKNLGRQTFIKTRL